jgi:hypothetical protein
LDHLLQVCLDENLSEINSISFAIGFLKDQTKNYELAFVLGGTMIIIASFFHFALSCVKPSVEEEEEKKEIEEVHV